MRPIEDQCFIDNQKSVPEERPKLSDEEGLPWTSALIVANIRFDSSLQLKKQETEDSPMLFKSCGSL